MSKGKETKHTKTKCKNTAIGVIRIISIQLNYLLFMCRLNSYKAKYRNTTV
jgi:hypothetical protein